MVVINMTLSDVCVLGNRGQTLSWCSVGREWQKRCGILLSRLVCITVLLGMMQCARLKSTLRYRDLLG